MRVIAKSSYLRQPISSLTYPSVLPPCQESDTPLPSQHPQSNSPPARQYYPRSSRWGGLDPHRTAHETSTRDRKPVQRQWHTVQTDLRDPPEGPVSRRWKYYIVRPTELVTEMRVTLLLVANFSTW